MRDPLEPLLADGVIDEVCARLKSGKEADLWLVRHGADVVAAKVYKAREARSFRNDAAYREGRRVRDTRTQRAMDRGSRFGQAAAEEAWKAKEADALHALHAAGVRVPRPVMFYEGVLLMELVLDAHGHPAPRLVDAPVAREQAAGLYADLRAQAVRMLTCDLVHGDLSPYNVLLGRDGPVVIDFPQVIGAAHNRQAEAFFVRDLENLRRHLAGVDPGLRAATGDAREIWRAYERRELTPDFVPSGRAEPAPRGGAADRRERRPHGAGRGGDAERQGRGGRGPGPARRDEAPRRGGGPDRRGREAGPRGEGGRGESGRGDRAARPGGAPERNAPRATGRHPPGDAARAPQGGRGPRPPGRGPERARGGSAPEVIRVSRPPLQAPASAGQVARPPAARPAHQAQGGQRPQDPRRHRHHGRRG